MQVIAHNPSSGVYPATSDYTHAIEVSTPQRLLFVTGTMGLDEAGQPGAALDEQHALIWNNLRDPRLGGYERRQHRAPDEPSA